MQKQKGFISKKEDPGQDINSVNQDNVKLAYFPLMYYIISRLHLRGSVKVFFKQIVPVTLAVYLFTNIGLQAFIIMPLSFLLFYSVYEIGGMFNDLRAKYETEGNPTNRIQDSTRINILLFVVIRIIISLSIIILLQNYGYSVLKYLVVLISCLVIYFIHSLITSNFRLITFIALKVFRNLVPLLILIDKTSPVTLFNIFLSFFIVDAPRRIYFYIAKRRDTRQTIRTFDQKYYFNQYYFYTLTLMLGVIIYITIGTPIYLGVFLFFTLFYVFVSKGKA